MSTTTTATRPLTENDLIDQLVIAWSWDEPITYHGPMDGREGVIIGATTRVYGPFHTVAPADTPLADPKDARIEVTKTQRGYYPTHRGPWRLVMAGYEGRGGFHKTKRDAVAAGRRRLAILDWHTANAT